MPGLTVDPEELDRLAHIQDRAADQADAGAHATHGLGKRVEESHGVVSHQSNAAVANKETERETAGQTLKQACLVLAAALRVAENSYVNADEDSARHIGHRAQG